MTLLTDMALYLLGNNRTQVMKFATVLSFSILLLAFSACTKKELPEAIDGKPQVWIECKVNGAPVKFAAGEDYTFGCPIVHDGAAGKIRQFTSEIKSQLHQKAIRVTINNRNANISDMQDDLENTIKTGAYKFSFTNQYPVYLYKLGEVIVDYTDLKDKYMYSSLLYPQVNVGHFEILSVKDVEFEGNRYKVAEISFSCMAQTPSNGAWFNITEGHGFIPFGQQ